MTEKKPEWALNLSTALKQWIPEQGYRASTELADKLNIPRGLWSDIYQGYSIAENRRGERFDRRTYYASIHLWTGLQEADPRTIPDRLIRIPNGGFANRKRSFSEDEYQQWLKSPNGQELLTKRNARFTREAIMESPIPQQAEPSATAGSLIGLFVDNLLNQQLKLGEQITRLESVIAGLVQSRVSRANDIGQLASQLTGLLEQYRRGTNDERDNLMRVHGEKLMPLDMIVHTLTRRRREREELLVLTEETKL